MKMEEKRWSDLHSDIVSQISYRLGLIDLLGFRGVCTYWRSSSCEASAAIESLDPVPWFLLYGETAQCSVLTNDNRTYKIEIPEMAESTCLASFMGWFLLAGKNKESLLFFCPFSRSKIEIPPCPLLSEQSELDVVAAFSSDPTDPNCTVVLVSKNKDDVKLRLFMLRRGESEWTSHLHTVEKTFFDKKRSVAVDDRAFHFFDDKRWLFAFEFDTETWTTYVFCNLENHNNGARRLNYWIDREGLNRYSYTCKSNEMKQLLGIDKDPCSVSVCGTMVLTCGIYDQVISHELIEDEDDGDDDDEEKSDKPRRELKGVWFQPRFHQISEDQKW